MRRTPKESTIEKWCYQWAEKRGWWQAKFKSPGFRSRPDRAFARWCDGGFRHPYVEFKRRGKEATDLQSEEHERMRAKGLEVYVIDDKSAFMFLIGVIEKGYRPTVEEIAAHRSPDPQRKKPQALPGWME